MLSEEQGSCSRSKTATGITGVSMVLLRHRSYITAYRDVSPHPQVVLPCHAQLNDPAIVRGPAFVADTDHVHPAYKRGPAFFFRGRRLNRGNTDIICQPDLLSLQSFLLIVFHSGHSVESGYQAHIAIKRTFAIRGMPSP